MYDARHNFDKYTRLCAAGWISSMQYGNSILEVGCGTGALSAHLTGCVTGIDISTKNIDICKSDQPQHTFICSSWEDFNFGQEYTDIVLSGILEHVEYPMQLLRKAKEAVGDGSVHIVVPNAHSFHRLLGVHMGLLGSVYEFSDGDVSIDHKRIYTIDKLTQQCELSGLNVICTEGLFVKFLPSADMEKLSEDVLIGLMGIANKFTDNASDIYMMCKVGEQYD